MRCDSSRATGDRRLALRNVCLAGCRVRRWVLPASRVFAGSTAQCQDVYDELLRAVYGQDVRGGSVLGDGS